MTNLSRLHPVYQQAYRFRQYLVILSCRDILQINHAL